MAGKKKQDDKESSINQLRSEAEKKVARSADKSKEMKKPDLDKLVHELQIHQDELAMKNEELRTAQGQLNKSRNDYADLYDFAPVGYLTFNGDVLITEVNLTGAALLGVERPKLLKRRFRQFVAPADAERWDRHFVSVLQQGEKQSCDLLLRRRDGSTLHARLDSIRVEMDDGTCIVRTAMSDITVQREAEEDLLNQFTILKAIIESPGTPIFLVDRNYCYIAFNSSHAAMMKSLFGADIEIGKSLLDYHTVEAQRKQAKQNIDRAISGESVIVESYSGEEQLPRRFFEIVHNPVMNAAGQVIGASVFARDLTERKLAEEAMRESEALLKATGEMAKVGGWELDLSTNQVSWTEEVGRIHGVEPGYQPKLGEALNFYAPESRPVVEAALKKIAETGEPYDIEALFIPSGSKDKIWVRSLGEAVYRGGKVVKLTGTFQNIDKYKRAEESLRASEEKHRALVENINDVLYTLDTRGNITYISPAIEHFTKYKVNDLIGKPFAPLVHTDDLPGLLDSFNRLTSGQLEPWEFRVLDKDGTIIFVRSSSRPIYKDGEIVGFTALLTDITDRKQQEEALGQEKEVLQTIIDNIPIMIASFDREGHYQWINRCWQSTLGWSLMEVLQTDIRAELYPDPEYRKYVADFIVAPGSTWGDFRTRTRNGRLLDTAWINVPLDDESSLGIGIDITERKQTEEKLLQSYESLKKTLNDAINTMAKIVEIRDPYTAGHQRKVAGLATAIAREMKLEDIRIEQLRMAAVIHDIGKMYIPSDILSKPGKLADLELGLIKTHSQSGYDIVKSMDFPCSIANTVLQHHERLDGSGYPNGLKCEDMLLEAKILAVADVIEAMASDRPYRPALGIAKALEEISKGKGKLYDPDAVDACLEVFNKGEFKFEDVSVSKA